MQPQVALLTLVLLAVPQVGWAAGFVHNRHLDMAAKALDAGDLDHASSELATALEQPDNSDDELVEIYRLQGIVALYKGDREAARHALVKLFQARPDYELPPGTAPKIRALFAEVQADVRAQRVKPVTLEFEPLDGLVAGGPASIQATVRDLPAAAHVRFFYRRVGSEAYGLLELHVADDRATAALPAAELPLGDAPFAIEYYLEVDDAAGRRLAGKGDALAPLTVRVRAPDSGQSLTSGAPEVASEPRWYQHWYTWTAIGAVLVAGGATTYYLLSRPNTGTLPIQVTFQ